MSTSSSDYENADDVELTLHSRKIKRTANPTSEEINAVIGTGVRKKMPNSVDIRFDLNNNEEWDIFIERLELLFESQEVEATKQVAELLTRVSANTYSLIRKFVSARKT